MKYLLTKSKYIRGLQCVRAMYLDVYRPEFGRLSRETRLKFAKGRSFEADFKSLYPEGIDVSRELGYKIDQYPDLTSELLDRPGEVVLFEAGFLYNEVLVLADVVRKTLDGRLLIYEVKNGLKISDTFRRDLAVQHYVISHCVAQIDGFSIVHNDGTGGFVIVDLLSEAIGAMPQIEQNIVRFKEILHGSEPRLDMGEHCDNPYECPYKEYCSGRIVAQLELGF